MGKRKDRRQATGRRVKLDLFADPSEDSSKQEEFGGDNLDNNEQTEIHNPSSPPGKKGNPLLLLGQYSDEESEEELEMSSDAKMEVEDNTAESNRAVNYSIEKQSPTNAELVKTDILEDENEKNVKEIHTNIQNPISQSQTCETQIITSDFGDWKTLIHEETNQYYYWNTLTGETSWELPPGIVPVPESVPVPVEEVTNVTGTDLVGTGGVGFVDGSVPVEDSVPVERQVAESERAVNVGTDFKADFDPEQLVKFGEDLLKKLAPLEGSFDKIGAIRKEIEIRVSDCKALSLYGSSLLPFWFHTETKLKLLEASVSESQETFSLSETSHNTKEERERSNTPLIEKEAIKEEEEDNEMLLLPTTENSGNEKDKQEIEKEKDKIKDETVIKPINMDVEMEVEEEAIPNDKIINFNDGMNNEKMDLPLLEEGEISDPTSDVWVPPPPPEDEPVPVPPESEPVPPPPEDEPVPPPPPPPEEELVPVPPPPPEEEEVSVSYTSELLVSYSSYVEPVQVPIPVPVPASSYQTYVGLPTYDFGASYQNYPQPTYYESLPYYTVPSPVPVPAIPIPVPVQNNPVEPAGTEVHRSVPNDGTVSDVGPTNEVSVQIAEAYSKTQNKGIKGKKRASAVAPTMRSNKKVASLVNKWKAASEELHVEPESAIETLEKKRQRAIEEWKANQIATGEAQENANFVPLGGDWREKVKKRQAKKAKKEEKSQISSEMDNNNNNNTNISSSIEDKKQEIKKPDLAKFSIGLPSNWQAYWDESSKQVYYGNVKTSETSWDRPK